MPTTIDAVSGLVVDDLQTAFEIPTRVQQQIDEIVKDTADAFKEAHTVTYQRIAEKVKETRDDLIDELDEETQYGSEDVAQYINSAINDTLAIVSDELPTAQDDRPLTDFYFEIINT